MALLAIAFCVCVVLFWLFFQAKQRLARYAPIRDIEAYRQQAHREVEQQRNAAKQQFAHAQQELARRQHEVQQQGQVAQQQLGQLHQQLADGQHRLQVLQAEVGAVEEELEMQSFGFYRPHYSFTDSEQFKHALRQTRDRQKQLVKNDGAANCPSDWTVDGSRAKGRKMVREQIKLMLRAFNGECDAAMTKVRYNNVDKMEARLVKSCEAVNKLGKSKNVWITRDYLELKLQELYLTHEHHEALQREKEEQRRIKEQMREEQRAQKEIDKAKAEAEKEEERQQRALEKARAELAKASGVQHEKFAALVSKLENELKEALDRKARAISRAQLTRSGHVYVISNLGSFGDGVFKIGMTRRFEPMLRVRELGDASVPFTFDVHAMIYSEDAPTLERALHAEFEQRRVNRVNTRKEFFRVSIDDIRKAVAKHHGVVTFVTMAEAEEYRKTVAIEREEAGRTRAPAAQVALAN